MTNRNLYFLSCTALGFGCGVFGRIVGAPFWLTVGTSALGATMLAALFSLKGWDTHG